MLTCTAIFRVIAEFPDWLTATGILFAAAIFGASAMIVYYEFRYRGRL